jgi:uncharacterized membrane protein YhfC
VEFPGKTEVSLPPLAQLRLIIGALALFALLAGYILWQKRKEDQADMKKYGRRK